MRVQEEREILAALIKEIEKAADDEIKKILGEAEKQKVEILKEAEERALKERKKKEMEIRRKARMEILKELSFKRISYRKKILLEKYKLITSLVDEARKIVIDEVRKGSHLYYLGLEKLLEEAIINLNKNNVIIICNKRDRENIEGMLQKVYESIKEKYNREFNAEIRSTLPDDEYGVIVLSSDKREYYINTISSRFDYYIKEYLPELLYKK